MILYVCQELFFFSIVVSQEKNHFWLAFGRGGTLLVCVMEEAEKTPLVAESGRFWPGRPQQQQDPENPLGQGSGEGAWLIPGALCREQFFDCGWANDGS